MWGTMQSEPVIIFNEYPDRVMQDPEAKRRGLESALEAYDQNSVHGDGTLYRNNRPWNAVIGQSEASINKVVTKLCNH